MKSINRIITLSILLSGLLILSACGGGSGGTSDSLNDAEATGRVMYVDSVTQTVNPGFPVVFNVSAEGGLDGNDLSVGFYLINKDKGFGENGEYVEQYFLGTKVLPVGSSGGTFRVSFIAPEYASAGSYSILSFTDPDIVIETDQVSSRMISGGDTVSMVIEENPDLSVEMVDVSNNVIVSAITGETSDETQYSATLKLTSYGHDSSNVPMTACIILPSGSCMPLEILDSKANTFTQTLYISEIRKNDPLSFPLEARLPQGTAEQILSQYTAGELTELPVRITINENGSIQEANISLAATLEQITRSRAVSTDEPAPVSSGSNNTVSSSVTFYSSKTVAVNNESSSRLYSGGYYTSWLHYDNYNHLFNDEFGGDVWLDFTVRGHMTPTLYDTRYKWWVNSSAEVKLTTDLTLFGYSFRLFDGRAFAERSDAMLSAPGGTEPVEFVYETHPVTNQIVQKSMDSWGYSVSFAGVQLINVNEYIREEFSLELTKYSYEKEFSKEKKYWVKLCFLNLRGGLKGEVGLEIRYDYSPDAGIDASQLRHALVAEPFLDTKAFGEVSVDIVIVEFGAGMELTIFRIGFPINGSFDTGLIDGHFKIITQLSSDMVIRVLDGRVYLFIEYLNIPICCKWGFIYYPCGWPYMARDEYTVVNWYGWGYEHNFYSDRTYLSADIPAN